jgi:hypothetical protein
MIRVQMKVGNSFFMIVCTFFVTMQVLSILQCSAAYSPNTVVVLKDTGLRIFTVLHL